MNLGVFHLFFFPLGISVKMLMMIVDTDQRQTKHKVEAAGRSLADEIEPP